jgi:phosphocarrier protein HPr
MMQQRTLMIENPLGLHARAGARLVKLANGFQSDILLARSDSPQRTANAKSIFSVLMLAATQGTMISITTEGEDEAEAMEALCRLVKEKFGEYGT